MLDTSITRPWLALAFLVWTLLAALAGWQTGREQEQDRCTAAIATLKADQATQERQAAQAALDRLQQAQARGDALQTRLAAEETNRQTQAQEHAREIKRLTTGRPCLNAGTVRLLNEPTGHSGTVPVPATTSGATAADAPASSDTDVAGWIDNARHQYDACRGRLDALIDWHQEAADGHR
jgi:type II secretory pathway pseudopilin PulG